VTDAGLIEDPQQGQLPEPLLTAEEACEILRVSRAHLYRRIRNGEWPHRLLGDGVGIRFSAEDLQEIIAMSYRPPVSGS
jgi:excisionase family DNA binding protein